MSGQPQGGQSGGYNQSSGSYPGQMGGGYGGMGNYGTAQSYGGYGSYGGGQYNPQNQYGGGQYGGSPNYGMGYQQPSQGWSGGPNMSGGYSQPGAGSIGVSMGNPMTGSSQSLPQDYMPPPMRGGNWMGLWNGGMPSYGQMGQQSQYVGGQQGGNAPIGLNTPGAQPELRQTGGAMPPQQPPPLNSTQILMNRAKAMQTGETPPYVPPQQAQPQPIQPPQQTIQPPAQNHQQQWQAQLKAAQDQLNLGPAQYGQQPKADDGSNYRDQNGNYYLETTPSTLDPGSMAGLQAWLGGSNSPFGSTVPQQQQGYTDWYNQTYGRQAPGGPTRY